jgi:hypothetical protein
MKRAALFLLLAAFAATVTRAAQPVALHDRAQLALALEKGPPCCVIDARAEGARALRPLADALVYRKGMKINPTAAVAVIADSDENGMRVGDELARTSHAPQVIVVKGGLATWEAATAPSRSASGGAALTFVIPKNTCEQDTPLQTLRVGPGTKTH